MASSFPHCLVGLCRALVVERGVIVIRGEEMATSADRIRLTMRGIDLRNKDGWFGKSDPYFTISRLREDEHWQQAGRLCRRRVFFREAGEGWS